MVRATSYSVSLTFKSQLIVVLLLRPMVVAGRILWHRFCPSLFPDICLGVSLDLDFLWVGIMPETLMKLCITTWFCEKTFFAPTIKMSKTRVFWILRKIWSLIFTVFNIENFYCCVPAQILYLGKILLLRYRPKSSQPIRLQDF